MLVKNRVGSKFGGGGVAGEAEEEQDDAQGDVYRRVGRDGLAGYGGLGAAVSRHGADTSRGLARACGGGRVGEFGGVVISLCADTHLEGCGSGRGVVDGLACLLVVGLGGWLVGWLYFLSFFDGFDYVCLCLWLCLCLRLLFVCSLTTIYPTPCTVGMWEGYYKITECTMA